MSTRNNIIMWYLVRNRFVFYVYFFRPCSADANVQNSLARVRVRFDCVFQPNTNTSRPSDHHHHHHHRARARGSTRPV